MSWLTFTLDVINVMLKKKKKKEGRWYFIRVKCDEIIT